MIKLYRYDAFTTQPGKGNPAGVVIETGNLSEAQMQAIAKQAAYSETAFVLPFEKADLQLRYFTPGKEVPMCGHATVGSMWLLRKLGKIGDGTVLAETRSGLLPIDVTQKDGHIQIGMTQVPYQEKAFGGSKAALAEAIGLTEEDIDHRFPIVYGYTGLWTLMFPIKTLEAFSRMKRVRSFSRWPSWTLVFFSMFFPGSAAVSRSSFASGRTLSGSR